MIKFKSWTIQGGRSLLHKILLNATKVLRGARRHNYGKFRARRFAAMFLAACYCIYICFIEITQAGHPDTDIVIVTKGAVDAARKSLKLLRRNTNWRGTKLYIVDAGSTNSALDWYADFCHPSFCVLTTLGHVGYTVAAGLAIKQTTSEHIVLMHPDVYLCDYWLTSLFEALDSCQNHAAVGPLSNAAGYQSVPKISAVLDDPLANLLPKDMTLKDMCEVVSKSSPRDFPDATLLDGFLLLLKRSAFDAVGGLDAENFPDEYGEHDFLLRLQNAGYTVAIADNTYAYHHHATDMAREFVDKAMLQSTQTTERKHGSHYQLNKDFMQSRILPLRSRQRISKTLSQKYDDPEQHPPKLFGMRIIFVLPVKGAGGGVISIVHVVNTMRLWGLDANIAVRTRDIKYYRRVFHAGSGLGSFEQFSDNKELEKLCENAHFVVATIYTSVKLVLQVHLKMPHFVPAYFIQDYEAWFSGEGSTQRLAAMESYDLAKEHRFVCFAKTNWIKNKVWENHDLHVSLVTPSLDHDVHSRGHCHDDSTIHVSAMVRMKSPRRSPEKTLRILTKLKERFDDRIRVTIFGSKDAELRRVKHLVDKLDENKGEISDEAVAGVLRKTDIFIDLSVYQAFGRTAAECMASGCVPVVPRDGGATEMLDNERAGVSVNSSDEKASYHAIQQLIERGMSPLRKMKLHAGMKASEMSTEAAARDVLLLFIGEHFNAQQRHAFGGVIYDR